MKEKIAFPPKPDIRQTYRHTVGRVYRVASLLKMQKIKQKEIIKRKIIKREIKILSQNQNVWIYIFLDCCLYDLDIFLGASHIRGKKFPKPSILPLLKLYRKC